MNMTSKCLLCSLQRIIPSRQASATSTSKMRFTGASACSRMFFPFSARHTPKAENRLHGREAKANHESFIFNSATTTRPTRIRIIGNLSREPSSTSGNRKWAWTRV